MACLFDIQRRLKMNRANLWDRSFYATHKMRPLIFSNFSACNTITSRVFMSVGRFIRLLVLCFVVVVAYVLLLRLFAVISLRIVLRIKFYSISSCNYTVSKMIRSEIDLWDMSWHQSMNTFDTIIDVFFYIIHHYDAKKSGFKHPPVMFNTLCRSGKTA